MRLPTPNLDTFHFQQIVDEAKRRIPQYCPEWTDHNVSDPGVTLIELFAWMTDMLLYRVNQVPDKMYVTFLDMIGVRLGPPRAATAPVTFYLSAPQSLDVTIPAETEVSTVRTETAEPIVFTTAQELTIRPPSANTGAFSRKVRPGGQGFDWVKHDLSLLELPGERIPIFSDTPVPGDAFFLALERDHSRHVLALVLENEEAGGSGIDPRTPPLEWQAYVGGQNPWRTCELEHDGTGGFNWAGEVILHLPDMTNVELQGVSAYWLRCRLLNDATNRYRVSPKIERLAIESRGGTVQARHATTVRDEVLGRSEGSAGQEFALASRPVLDRNPQTDHLIVELPDGRQERWAEVSDFGDSHDGDRHYTLDSLSGTLTLPPMLRQPDGSVYRFGVVPPTGSTLRFSRYQTGGGVEGNVPRSAIALMKTSIPYVARVDNRRAATGGLNGETLQQAMLRAPQMLRTRTRAVTADDYVYLAAQSPDVARASCAGPGSQPGAPGEPRPGEVVVALLPHIELPPEEIAPELLKPSAELCGTVRSMLLQRSPVGVRLEVREATLVWVSAEVALRLPDRSDAGQREETVREARAALYRYLNPYTGGPSGEGWPFGRELHVSELYALLQRVPGIEFVESLKLFLDEPGSGAGPQPVSGMSVLLERHGVVCSYRHKVEARTAEEAARGGVRS